MQRTTNSRPIPSLPQRGEDAAPTSHLECPSRAHVVWAQSESFRIGRAITSRLHQRQREIKDTNRVTDSRQLRIQREAAQSQGKAHEVQIGTNTRSLRPSNGRAQ